MERDPYFNSNRGQGKSAAVQTQGPTNGAVPDPDPGPSAGASASRSRGCSRATTTPEFQFRASYPFDYYHHHQYHHNHHQHYDRHRVPPPPPPPPPSPPPPLLLASADGYIYPHPHEPRLERRYHDPSRDPSPGPGPGPDPWYHRQPYQRDRAHGGYDEHDLFASPPLPLRREQYRSHIRHHSYRQPPRGDYPLAAAAAAAAGPAPLRASPSPRGRGRGRSQRGQRHRAIEYDFDLRYGDPASASSYQHPPPPRSHPRPELVATSDPAFTYASASAPRDSIVDSRERDRRQEQLPDPTALPPAVSVVISAVAASPPPSDLQQHGYVYPGRVDRFLTPPAPTSVLAPARDPGGIVDIMDRDSRSRRYDDGETATGTSLIEHRAVAHEAPIATGGIYRETGEISETQATAGDDAIGAVVFVEALRRDDLLRHDVAHREEVRREGTHPGGMTEIVCDLHLEEATTQGEGPDLHTKEIVVETEPPRDVRPLLSHGPVHTEPVPVVQIAVATIVMYPRTPLDAPHPLVTRLFLLRSRLEIRLEDRRPMPSPSDKTIAHARKHQSPLDLYLDPRMGSPLETEALRERPKILLLLRHDLLPAVLLLSGPLLLGQETAVVVIRQDMVSPGVPPSGPRGYVAARGGGYGRGGGRGGPSWGSTIQSRNIPSATGPASATAATGPSSIPTGPRAGPASQSVPSTPVAQSKPFNPPKGPAADSNRPSLAQQLIASMPPIIPGGKMDPYYAAMSAGVLPELLPHTQRLKEEEEKIREEKYAKEEKLRKSLALWDKLEREAKVLELRTELSENSLKKFAGEGVGGAAF
ncbi:hypothetical protein F5X99DRAFT_411071 [Biscogniauxia marginata]|nr:hypothetical protein F5X99DRAFT_411071 [Biscogniauxia marginata]